MAWISKLGLTEHLLHYGCHCHGVLFSVAETAVVWIPIRRRGKLLFEYDPQRLRVRVKVRGQEELVVVELAGVDAN